MEDLINSQLDVPMLKHLFKVRWNMDVTDEFVVAFIKFINEMWSIAHEEKSDGNGVYQ